MYRVGQKNGQFFASMNAFTDWAEILHTFNVIYYSSMSTISSWFIQWFRSYTYFCKASRRCGWHPNLSIATAFRWHPSLFSEKTMSNRECNRCFDFESSRAILIARHYIFRRNDRSSRGKAACARFTARLAKISVTPKPLNESTCNFRQEWIISYIKCMQNFSSIGKRIHARKKFAIFLPPCM